MIDILTTIRHRVGNCRAIDVFSKANFYFWELKNNTNRFTKKYKLEVLIPNEDLLDEIIDNNYDTILVDALFEYEDIVIDITIDDYDDYEFCDDNLDVTRRCLEKIYKDN